MRSELQILLFIILLLSRTMYIVLKFRWSDEIVRRTGPVEHDAKLRSLLLFFFQQNTLDVLLFSNSEEIVGSRRGALSPGTNPRFVWSTRIVCNL